MPNRSKSNNRSGSKSHKQKRRDESSVSSDSDSSSNRELRKSKSSKKIRNKSHRRKRRDESSNSSDPGRSDIKEARVSKRSESKSHKQKRRDTSSDSSDSTCSDNAEITLLLKLEKERKKALEIRKRQKELMKANETPEQKRLRRLRKKQEKEKKVKEKMGWDNDYLHYTNSDNPFGDGDLLSTFLWKKKLNKDGLEGISKEELEMRNKFKQGENKRELEKVKKRRIERDLEKQRKEEETLIAQRTKEATQFEEWQRQEDTFHLEQARLRSHIRIQDGRAKPIDLLAKYISAEEEVDAVEMHEPYTYLNGLLTKDLEDLVEDIKVYKELEKGKNIDYWNDITIIVEDELQKLRKLEHQNEIDVGLNRREGIHQSVASDVTSVFKGKTTGQLATLQQQIEAKISKKTDGLDIGYWESLLSQLKAHMARARLQDRHKESLHRKLQVLKAEQAVATVASTSTLEDDKDLYSDESDENEDNFTSPLDECFKAYEAGGYSPRLLTVDDVELGTIVSTEEDDLKRLQFARQQITENNSKHTVSKEEKLFEKEVRKDMGEDEAQFSVEASLENQVYLWSDKYRPRKPRYFNRVHTGFEWNKYNQTHYDMDNPPPKIVQGYKFNIFYPDLIDKYSTPEYYLTTCQDKEFSILRFHAGPPYEDIAFKIVNREWEYSYKRGFRCQFHNNIFQLWFHFKRYRYRR